MRFRGESNFLARPFLSEKRRRLADRLFEADAPKSHALGKRAQQPRRQRAVEHHEDAAVVGAADQPAEGLLAAAAAPSMSS